MNATWGHPDQWCGADARREMEALRAQLAEMQKAARAARTTLLAIVNTRDGRLDNVWQRMARKTLDELSGEEA